MRALSIVVQKCHEEIQCATQGQPGNWVLKYDQKRRVIVGLNLPTAVQLLTRTNELRATERHIFRDPWNKTCIITLMVLHVFWAERHYIESGM